MPNKEGDFSEKLFLLFLCLCAVFTLMQISFFIILRMATSPLIPVSRLSGPSVVVRTPELPKCDSCSDLKNKLQAYYKESKEKGWLHDDWANYRGIQKTAPMTEEAPSAPGGIEVDYSETNIQVAGVDEADIVKTDGKYIYTVSKNTLTISEAYPPEQAKLLSKIELSSGSSPNEIFIDDDNLLVFGRRNYYHYYPEMGWMEEEVPEIYPYPYPNNLTFVEIYNVSDRQNPILKRKLEFAGNYLSSRKIDNYVYFVLNSYPDYRIFEKNKRDWPMSPTTDETKGLVPVYRDLKGKEINKEKEFKPLVKCSEISYIEPINDACYISVIGLPIDNYIKEPAKKVILGSSQNIYASLKNLYIVNAQYQYSRGFLKEIIDKVGESREKTEIYKFSLDKDKIQYLTKGEVPGTILNQFSMDEYNSYFRIATTKHLLIGQNQTSNNIYILDTNLKKVSSIENIAPGEKIYSVRFMGPKAYLVTFKKLDPFFTLDLSNPKKPKILGKLKIPGYSDYLHPYDENHIIGIGKETTEEKGWGVVDLGIKMALFDVSDFNNPREMYKVRIGDRGTQSPIIQDHKAFLFDKEKNLLVIPVLVAEISQERKADPDLSPHASGDYVFQGSYVYDISLDKGFVLKGRVTHYESDEIFKKSGDYFSGDNLNIKRNLYIDNYLYSISDGKILINSLNDLSEKGKIEL